MLNDRVNARKSYGDTAVSCVIPLMLVGIIIWMGFKSDAEWEEGLIFLPLNIFY